MERAAANCILCNGSERSLLIRQGEWSVYRCNGCGLGLLDPRPDPDELNELYRSGYFESNYGQGLKTDSPEMKHRLSQETHRIRFFKKAGKRGRLLDIGCGMGYFLLACRDAGYEVEGMPGGFDVVWLSHVLHGEGPEGCEVIIRKAVAALEPGGMILVQEFILDDSMDGPPFPALFSLNMLLGTNTGQAYSQGQLTAMLAAAGVGDLRRIPLELPNGAGIIAGIVE